MKTILLSLLLLAGWCLSAADLTGKWSGTVAVKDDGGDSQDVAVMVTLKQDGNTLTGTAGAEGEEHPIQKGVVNGDTVTFEVDSGDAIYYLELKVDGDQLTGEVKNGADGPKMKLSLKRVKET